MICLKACFKVYASTLKGMSEIVYFPVVEFRIFIGAPPNEIVKVPDIKGECCWTVVDVKVPGFVALYFTWKLWFLTAAVLNLPIETLQTKVYASAGTSVIPSVFDMVSVQVVE